MYRMNIILSKTSQTKKIMKKSLVYFLSILIAASITVTSCKKSQDLPVAPVDTQVALSKGAGTVAAAPPSDTTTSLLPISQILNIGTWKVTAYVEGIENSSLQFLNFNFTFKDDGTMIADEKGKFTYGTWKPVVANFYYGNPIGSNPDGFNIIIGSKRPLILMGKNLFIRKKTLTTVYLDSVNPAENAHMTLSR